MSHTFKDHLAQTTPFPFGIKVSHAEGSYIYDTDGKAYLDLISGIAVSYLGHGREEIKDAIKAQTDKHLHVMVYGEFEQEAQNELAEELKQTLPKSLHSFYFVNSGTEANEAALKLAKRATGRRKLISFKGAYHGSTHGSLSVSFNEIKKNPFRPLLPDVHFIELNNFGDLNQITEKTAAVIMESIQGDAGVRIPSKEYMQALRKRCSEVGALLILDEIQSGMGRSGKMWAFEHYDMVPDLMTSGKALGAGLPIGCLAASNKLMQKFSVNPMLGHITTFGGHPLVCAAAAAGLKVLRKEKLIEKVDEKAQLIKGYLKHPKIVEVRNRGLMFAVELQDAEQVQKVVLKGLEEGLLLFWFLSTPNAFRLAPPLTISKEEIEKGMKKLLELLDE
ncbi:MAG: aspartate aminotransferase family protein [Flavobacteriales bacterium]|nr:aspartate aminotransferase family protein [Flavobacteriales bacterium]MAC95535.1 aspartate aminotransferase family protein [Flavobacteriales bacterium]|tara:strand:+ start:10791 stop:11963 length:1173 start_codon:yes stop_codon:yes gene_type:complete